MRKLCNCVRRSGDNVVVSGCSFTPAQVYDASMQGIPISQMTLAPEYFNDGSKDSSDYVPLHERRGVDIIDCWNSEMDVRKKTIRAYHRGKQQQQQQSTNPQTVE